MEGHLGDAGGRGPQSVWMAGCWGAGGERLGFQRSELGSRAHVEKLRCDWDGVLTGGAMVECGSR